MISTKRLLKRILLCSFLTFCINVSAQTTLTSDNFTSGWGNWNDGGENASLSSWTPMESGQGVALHHNNGQNSSTYSNNIDLTPYSTATIAFDFEIQNFWWGLDFYVEYSGNGGSSWTEIGYYRNPDYGNGTTFHETIVVDASVLTFSSNSRFRIRCDSANNRPVYIDNITIKGYPPLPEIDVKGNLVSIADGDTTPYVIDNTDFGTAATNTTITKAFRIDNLGNATLTISSISLSNTTDFSIVGAPYSGLIAASDRTGFSVRYNAINTGVSTSTVTINNSDPNKNPYTFIVKAEATINFFDSDGDGVLDDADTDDDNDGIADYVEELACQNSSISTSTNYKYLNETFGTGNRTQINTTYNAITTYCYEDGYGSCGGNPNLGDSKYTVYHRAADGDDVNDTPNEEVAAWADQYWYTGEDHTGGDITGRMAMFNATIDPGLFYTAHITGSLPNVPVTYSFWALNLDTTTAPGINNRLRPDIKVEFRDINDNLLASITTGDIPPSVNGNPAASWHNFTANLTFPVNEFNVFFYNNQLGGLGNDLAIDDISITQNLCDTDGDGVANVFDLDSDNDGIPDAVEAGFSSLTTANGVLNTLVDLNNNGMHDVTELATPLDSDNDGVPNYIDLDSDNDGIFDVDESGSGNSNDAQFQNGDGDIDGDGVGDGPDTDAVREKDVNSDGVVEFYTDGILDIYDYYNGTTFTTGYGNNNQGVGHTYFVLDSDGDGTPDYIDIYNNSNGTFDISNTFHADLDANNDGIIDGSLDADGDGILDDFDTNSAKFGSPRDMSGKFQLYFDGRNDYVEDSSLLSGLSELSLMGWIKIDPSGTGNQLLFGQDNFYFRLLSNKRLYVSTGNKTLISTTSIPTGQWVHLAATYSDTTNNFRILINGKENTSRTVNGALSTDTSPFYLGRRANSSSPWFYNGFIDEVRVFDKALSDDEIQKMVYQEIEQNGSNIRGSEIPRDITDFIDVNTINPLPWSNLIKYYRLDNFKGDVTDNLSTPNIDTGNGAKLRNIKIIEHQSAPMPFMTQRSGSLSAAVTNVDNGINGVDAVTYDWSIVKVEHTDVTFDNRQKHLGLFINELDASSNPIEYHVTNDSELNVSWYLKLDGFIDLEGESQLLQGEDSNLDAASIGKIERDQQGTADTFTYNYWSSPVKRQNSATSNFRIMDVMMDGSDPNNPSAINFSSLGYDGAATNPIKLADYWIWKYANLPTSNNSSWQHVRRTGTVLPGEGFTMKGPGTGSISTPQNYVFTGEPNNGDVNLVLATNSDYLVGNPYPSAIDAIQFIKDNGPELLNDNTPNPDSTPLISGTLYYWEHWGGGSHLFQDYQGGYATFNFSGAVAAAYKGSNHPDITIGGSPTKEPGRAIPVGQGFFVTGKSAGTINFNNGQRVFRKEGNSSSVFLRSANNATFQNNDVFEGEDLRMKFRIGFNSVNTIRRQLLLTIDENATPNVDWAFDGMLNEVQIDDMYWIINDEAYIIQASNEAEISTIYPLGIKTNIDGINTILLDDLENVPSDINIYLHDIELDLYHDLRTGEYEIFLSAGEHLDRFEITFDNYSDSLSIDDQIASAIDVVYSSDIKKIVIVNPYLIEMKSMTLINMLGQTVYTINSVEQSNYSEYEIKNLSVGTYIIKLQTESGSVMTKKILVD